MFILTREENLYDQQGEYFCAAFLEKPTLEKLINLFKGDLALSAHVQKGGGRRGAENVWYNLFEVQDGENYGVGSP